MITAALFAIAKKWKQTKCPSIDKQIQQLPTSYFTHGRISLVAQRQRIYLQCRRHRFNPWVGQIPWRRKWQPIPMFLPGKSHGQRSLVGYSPWDLKRVGHELATKQQQSVCMSVLLSQFIPPSPSPLCPYIQSLHLCLYSCPENRFIRTVHTHTHTHTHRIITQP